MIHICIWCFIICIIRVCDIHTPLIIQLTVFQLYLVTLKKSTSHPRDPTFHGYLASRNCITQYIVPPHLISIPFTYHFDLVNLLYHIRLNLYIYQIHLPHYNTLVISVCLIAIATVRILIIRII